MSGWYWGHLVWNPGQGGEIIQYGKEFGMGPWMMPLTSSIEEPAYDTQKKNKENLSSDGDFTINGSTSAETTSDYD